MTRIPVDREKIAEFCKRRGIRKLSLFGSVQRDDFGPDSDVDVLVEFEPEYTPGLDFFRIESELSEIIGRKVDLNTPKFLGKRFREQVIEESETQYASR
jgi:hypothetical protein